MRYHLPDALIQSASERISGQIYKFRALIHLGVQLESAPESKSWRAKICLKVKDGSQLPAGL